MDLEHNGHVPKLDVEPFFCLFFGLDKLTFRFVDDCGSRWSLFPKKDVILNCDMTAAHSEGNDCNLVQFSLFLAADAQEVQRCWLEDS